MKRLDTVLAVVAVNGNVRFPFTDTKAVREESIEALSLDARSYNGLRRSNVHTIGELLDVIDNGTLSRLRNLGRKSINKILYRLCAYQYEKMSKKEQDKFLTEIVKMNTV